MKEQPSLNDEYSATGAAAAEAAEGATPIDPTESFKRRGQVAWDASDNWFDTAMRSEIERATAMFNNQHPSGSKFNSQEYEKRSKIYRPKTRTAIRKIEAAGAVSLFSTSDMVNYGPVNPANPMQRLAADIMNIVVNMRLNDADMRWYVKCLGGIQEAATNGVVISMQKWVAETGEPLKHEMSYVDEFGNRISNTVDIATFTRDTFDVELVPIERIRFSPASDWANPVKSSPYIIHEMPMFLGDLHNAMQKREGAWKWVAGIDKAALIAGSDSQYDSITRAREPKAADRYNNESGDMDYKTVWIQHHIHRIEGRDMVWLSMRGNNILLTTPVPLKDVYRHGIRPYAFGWTINEAHRLYKSGIPKLLEGLAEETNSVINARLENLYLALHKRYYVRRGSTVDVRSLLRNVPGSVTMMSNVNNDVREVNTNDVTQSSYQEQDRLNLDIDDLVGSMSGATVGSARNLNETVGGMNLMQDNASQLSEYAIRTVAETWIREVYTQLAQLVAAYETDEDILSTVSGRFGFDKPEDVIEAMSGKIQVSVSAGYGATSPQKRIEKISAAVNATLTFDKTGVLIKDINAFNLAADIFGAVGLDANRYFPGMGKEQEDPQVASLKAQMEEVQGQLAQALDQNKVKLELEKVRGEFKERAEAIKGQVAIALGKGGQEMDAVKALLQKELDQASMLIEKQYNDEEQRLERLALIMNMRKEKHASNVMKQAPADLFDDSQAALISRDRYGAVPRAEG